MDTKMDYSEALQVLKDQISTMLDQCDGFKTPALCKLMTIEGNKERMIDSIVELVKKGYETDEAIALLEREYNPNAMDD